MESLFKFIISVMFVIGAIVYLAPVVGVILLFLLAIIYHNWELFAISGSLLLILFIFLLIKNNRKSQKS